MNSFNQIHHLEASFSKDFGGQLKWNKEEYLKMKELETLSFSMASGAFKGSAAGAVTAFGAYGGAMTFGAASTGTAIASLSGAAATNATLAFLGGGSLAAGGLGVAGGTMVLGGLVAGPALAVLGFTLSAKASANLDNARSNLAKAREIAESLATVRDTCYHIRDVAQEYAKTLRKLRPLLASLTEELQQVIRDYGTIIGRTRQMPNTPLPQVWPFSKSLHRLLARLSLPKTGLLANARGRLSTGRKND